MKKLIPVLLGLPLLLTACGFGGNMPSNVNTANFSLVNGAGSGYSEATTGVAIKKILSDTESTVYVLNNKGHLWQYNGSSWTNLNQQPGLTTDYFINDFYYSNGYIFAVDNLAPNSFFVYDKQKNRWTNLTPSITEASDGDGFSTIISGTKLSSTNNATINLLIGYRSKHTLPPQILNCNFLVESNVVESCISYTFAQPNTFIQSIATVAGSTWINLANNIFYNKNLNQFNSWDYIALPSTGNIVQILPSLAGLHYIATESGVFMFNQQTNVFSQLAGIPGVASSLNNQIMSFDTANSVWVATTDASAIYSIDSYGHISKYTMNMSNGSYAPLTALATVNKIVQNKIYLGNRAGEVFEKAN